MYEEGYTYQKTIRKTKRVDEQSNDTSNVNSKATIPRNAILNQLNRYPALILNADYQVCFQRLICACKNMIKALNLTNFILLPRCYSQCHIYPWVFVTGKKPLNRCLVAKWRLSTSTKASLFELPIWKFLSPASLPSPSMFPNRLTDQLLLVVTSFCGMNTHVNTVRKAFTRGICPLIMCYPDPWEGNSIGTSEYCCELMSVKSLCKRLDSKYKFAVWKYFSGKMP